MQGDLGRVLVQAVGIQLLQGDRRPAVVLTPSLDEQRVIGCLLRQRMLEDVLELGLPSFSRRISSIVRASSCRSTSGMRSAAGASSQMALSRAGQKMRPATAAI